MDPSFGRQADLQDLSPIEGGGDISVSNRTGSGIERIGPGSFNVQHCNLPNLSVPSSTSGGVTDSPAQSGGISPAQSWGDYSLEPMDRSPPHLDLEFQRGVVAEEMTRRRAQRLVVEKQNCTLSGQDRENRKKAIKVLLCEARRHQLQKKRAFAVLQQQRLAMRNAPANNQRAIQQQTVQQPTPPPAPGLDLSNDKMFKVVSNDLGILMKEDAVMRKPRTGHTLPKGCVDNYFFVTTELSLLRLW